MKRYFKPLFAVGCCLLVVAVASISLGWRGDAARAAGSCDWQVLDGPGGVNMLDVAAHNATTAWAVGVSTTRGTAIERWNGQNWSLSPSPNAGSYPNYLLGVTTLATNDAWAVGSFAYDTIFYHGHTLVEHWDGHNWNIVTSPDAANGEGQSFFYGVAATAKNNAWAVGAYNSQQGPQPLIERWNGHTWKQMSLDTPILGSLNRIAILSPNNIWAVGHAFIPMVHTEPALILHWNGKTWSQVTSPTPANIMDATLSDITALAPDNIWAAGSYTDNNEVDHFLVEHWDGHQWTIVPTPQLSKSQKETVPQQHLMSATPQAGVETGDTLTGITALSSRTLWAVGYTVGSDGLTHTVTMQYSKNAWNIVASPDRGQNNVLESITHAPHSNQVWAVGTFTLKPGPQALNIRRTC